MTERRRRGSRSRGRRQRRQLRGDPRSLPDRSFSIFGEDLGPEQLEVFELNEEGEIDEMLGDLMIFFDGYPGRILSANLRAGQRDRSQPGSRRIGRAAGRQRQSAVHAVPAGPHAGRAQPVHAHRNRPRASRRAQHRRNRPTATATPRALRHHPDLLRHGHGADRASRSKTAMWRPPHCLWRRTSRSLSAASKR